LFYVSSVVGIAFCNSYMIFWGDGMLNERETPFSFTEEEYEAFKKKVFTFDNERKSDQPLFVEMLEDISRFEKTKTCKLLVKTISGM